VARRVVDLDPLEVRWQLYVQPLYQTLHSGEVGLAGVPHRLKQILQTESWREFTPPGKAPLHYDDFAAFVTAPPTDGLGGSIDVVTRLVAADDEAADLLDLALKRRPGRPSKTSNNITNNAVGTSAAQALRRLRKDRPDLHARVLANELTPHRAMVEAGFRRRTATVPLDDLDALAATLRRHLTADQIAELARNL
jgi:hypothetical protein